MARTAAFHAGGRFVGYRRAFGIRTVAYCNSLSDGLASTRPMSLALLKKVWQAFNEDKALRLASSIAFSTIFSIAPLFIVLIAIVGWVIGLQNGGHGHTQAENAMLDQVSRGAGKATADTIRQIVAASFNKPRQGLLAQIIGWIAFIFGATALFSALQDSFNAIWHVAVTKGGWKQNASRPACFVRHDPRRGFLVVGDVCHQMPGSHSSARTFSRMSRSSAIQPLSRFSTKSSASSW